MKKKLSLLFCALFMMATFAVGQTLSDADRDKGVQYLEKTRDGVVSTVKGLSDAQMNFKAGPDRWSVAQVLEHIALAEDYLYQNVTNNVLKAPTGAADRDTAKIDAAVLAMIPDRSHKAQAPPPLVPTGRWTGPEALDHFLKAHAKTIELMKTGKDLRAHATDSPLGQQLDAYEWLLFISAHSERHTKQIQEVKDNANFPKK